MDPPRPPTEGAPTTVQRRPPTDPTRHTGLGEHMFGTGSLPPLPPTTLRSLTRLVVVDLRPTPHTPPEINTHDCAHRVQTHLHAVE